MKGLKSFGMFAAAVTIAAAAQAATEEIVEAVVEETSAEITVDYYSAYVWRGQVCNSAAVLQPAFAAETPFGLSLEAWGNMDATKKNDLGGKFNEVDLGAYYALPLEGLVSVELGIVNYLYPYHDEQTTEEDGEVIVDAADDTTEINATVSLDVLLNPTFMLSRDIDNCGGYYGNVGVDYGMDLTESLAMDLAASVGFADSNYNDYYFGYDGNKFNDLNLTVSASYEVLENVSVGATVAYTYLLDEKIRDAAEEVFGYKDHFYGGLNFAYSF